VTGGRGAPHFPRLQTILNPKFTFPHLGQVQSPSFREAGICKHNNFKLLNWKRQITRITDRCLGIDNEISNSPQRKQ
jgi:hypothetical protein